MSYSDSGPWFLVGLPGSGKSKVGRILASVLKVPHIDVDTEIENLAGKPISSIFEDDGEPAFRALEQEVILDTPQEPSIVSLGGGAIETPAVRTFLNDQTVVWIDAPDSVLISRVTRNSRRPLLRDDPAGTLRSLRQRRDPLFGDVASVRVQSTHGPAEEVAQEVLQKLRDWDFVTVRGTHRYNVITGCGSSNLLANYIPDGSTKVFLVAPDAMETAATEAKTSLEQAGIETVVFLHPDGERAKQLPVVAQAWDLLGETKVGRQDVVVTLGGGVTTDLGGFIAATWLRGIPVIHVPTTLLAMVDAAVGGKTGIDTAAGKNLVGAFYDPLVVLVDLDFLKTLPEPEYVAGLAEVIKTGLIDDVEILAQVEAHPELAQLAWAAGSGMPVLADLVRRSIAVKAKVVSSDRLEAGLRETLNYGHTMGHAIERAENYTMRHGEAVAIGAVFAAHLAAYLGLAPQDLVTRHEELFQSVGLPIRYRGDLEALMVGLTTDKKVRQGNLRFVLVPEEGQTRVQPVSPEDVLTVASNLEMGA